MIHVAKTKVLISFAVTATLICAFVFANADCWFSHAAAQILLRWPSCQDSDNAFQKNNFLLLQSVQYRESVLILCDICILHTFYSAFIQKF